MCLLWVVGDVGFDEVVECGRFCGCGFWDRSVLVCCGVVVFVNFVLFVVFLVCCLFGLVFLSCWGCGFCDLEVCCLVWCGRDVVGLLCLWGCRFWGCCCFYKFFVVGVFG